MSCAIARQLPAFGLHEGAVISEGENVHIGTLMAIGHLPLNPCGKLLIRRDGNELRERPVVGMFRRMCEPWPSRRVQTQLIDHAGERIIAGRALCGQWLASDEGSMWLLRCVDAIVEAIGDGTGSTFAPVMRAKL